MTFVKTKTHVVLCHLSCFFLLLQKPYFRLAVSKLQIEIAYKLYSAVKAHYQQTEIDV